MQNSLVRQNSNFGMTAAITMQRMQDEMPKRETKESAPDSRSFVKVESEEQEDEEEKLPPEVLRYMAAKEAAGEEPATFRTKCKRYNLIIMEDGTPAVDSPFAEVRLDSTEIKEQF